MSGRDYVKELANDVANLRGDLYECQGLLSWAVEELAKHHASRGCDWVVDMRKIERARELLKPQAVEPVSVTESSASTKGEP